MSNRLHIIFAFIVIVNSISAQEFMLKSNYKDINDLYNIYKESSNPAFIEKKRFNTLTDVRINYNHKSGDFHRVDEENINNGVGFNLYGIKKYNKLSFEGSFNYNYNKEKSKRWNSTLLPSDENPFIISDKVYSDFITEQFFLNGGVAYQFSQQITGGLRASLKSGSSANDSDPRPNINGIRFNINPGFSIKGDKNTFGLSFEYERLSESIEYMYVENHPENTVYLMSGISESKNNPALSYKRRYFGNNFGGSLQWAHEINSSKSNFMELSYTNILEKAEDGAMIDCYKGGDFCNNKITFTNRYYWNNNIFRHQLQLNANINIIKGTSYEQEQGYDKNMQLVWKTKRKYTTHEENNIKGYLSYRFDKINDSLSIYTLLGKVGFIYDKIKDPSTKSSTEFSSIFINAQGAYNFSFDIYRLKTSLSAKYNLRLTDKFNVDYKSLSTPHSIMANNYIRPIYAYNSASYLQMQVRAELQRPIKIKNGSTWLGVFAQYDFTNYMDSYKALKALYPIINGSRHYIKTGINLTF